MSSRNGSLNQIVEYEGKSTVSLLDMKSFSDIYQPDVKNKESQIIYTNVAEIKVIPDSSEAKLSDIKIKLNSKTLNVSRKFKPENS